MANFGRVQNSAKVAGKPPPDSSCLGMKNNDGKQNSISKKAQTPMKIFAGFLVLLVLAASSAWAQAGQPPATYAPTFESVKKHPLPDWFADAKFGISIHWGLYSVPAWASPVGEPGSVSWEVWFKNNAYAEWYLNTLKFKDAPTWV